MAYDRYDYNLPNVLIWKFEASTDAAIVWSLKGESKIQLISRTKNLMTDRNCILLNKKKILYFIRSEKRAVVTIIYK